MNALPSSGVMTLENRAENGVASDTTEKRNWFVFAGETLRGSAELVVVPDGDDRWLEGFKATGDEGCVVGGDEEGAEAETECGSFAGRENGRGMFAFFSASGGKSRLATAGWPLSSPIQRWRRGRAANCTLHTLACSGDSRTPSSARNGSGVSHQLEPASCIPPLLFSTPTKKNEANTPKAKHDRAHIKDPRRMGIPRSRTVRLQETQNLLLHSGLPQPWVS